MLERVSKSGFALQYAAEELKGDREIVMVAVSQNGMALQFAKEELKGDREIVMRAVSTRGYALRFASQELKGDKEVMQHALRPRILQGRLIGLKVRLLSGRCCDEIFLYYPVGNRNRMLRRCAELLDLDPDHVARSGVLMRGTVEVQERQIRKRRFWSRLRVEARRRFESAANLPKCASIVSVKKVLGT